MMLELEALYQISHISTWLTQVRKEVLLLQGLICGSNAISKNNEQKKADDT